MILTAYKRVGNVLFGWDGYGKEVQVTVTDRVASQVGQELCYTNSVRITLAQ